MWRDFSCVKFFWRSSVFFLSIWQSKRHQLTENHVLHCLISSFRPRYFSTVLGWFSETVWVAHYRFCIVCILIRFGMTKSTIICNGIWSYVPYDIRYISSGNNFLSCCIGNKKIKSTVFISHRENKCWSKFYILYMLFNFLYFC